MWTIYKKQRKIQKFKEIGDSQYIYQNEQDKACFQHDMAYGDFKDLTKRKASDKILRVKAFNIAKNPKYDGYQRSLASMVYRFFHKKTSGSGIKNENMSDQQLPEELHKPVIRKFNKRKVKSPFIDNIWVADLADMQLISKFNKGIRLLLCVIDIFSKYVWVIPLKNKKGVTITNAFQKYLKESNRKPNKIWVEKGREFYNRSLKPWLEKNDIEIYATHNEGKFVLAERFIRTLKNKNYKYMTSISKNVYIDQLDDIVNKYNNTCHRTIKMKPVNVKQSIYIDSSKEINDEDPKFKIGDIVRISKYTNIFAKVYVPNCYEEVFVIKKVKNTVP